MNIYCQSIAVLMLLLTAHAPTVFGGSKYLIESKPTINLGPEPELPIRTGTGGLPVHPNTGMFQISGTNYCGSGKVSGVQCNETGCTASLPIISEWKKPTGETDQCCLRHDLCIDGFYLIVGSWDYPTTWKFRPRAGHNKNECDNDACDCAKRVGSATMIATFCSGASQWGEFGSTKPIMPTTSFQGGVFVPTDGSHSNAGGGIKCDINRYPIQPPGHQTCPPGLMINHPKAPGRCVPFSCGF